MSSGLTFIILIASLLVAILVFRKIRKSHFVIEDTLYWLFFCLLLIIMSAFPKLIFAVSDLIGFESPSNFVFCVVIFLLLAKVFLMSVKVSRLETKLGRLIQKYAIDNVTEEEKKEEK